MIRAVKRHPIAHARAAIMPNDCKALMTECSHHSNQLDADRALVPGPSIERLAVPVAWQVGNNDRVAGRQSWRDSMPAGMALRIAMQQEDGRPLSSNYPTEARAWGRIV